MAGGLAFGFVAGLLSVLSPCVLPLLPLVLAGAASAHRLGGAALGAGLVLSFVAIGLFVATIGFSLGLTGELFRGVGAALLAAAGVVLLSATLQLRVATALGGIEDAGHRLAARLPAGLVGQFALGLLLGAIWSPCVGPTLGAASVLAAQGRDLMQVALVMAAFAAGATLPLLAVGAASRATLRRWQGRLVGAGHRGRQALGGALLLVAVAILVGADRRIEAGLVAASPGWLTALTTRF